MIKKPISLRDLGAVSEKTFLTIGPSKQPNFNLSVMNSSIGYILLLSLLSAALAISTKTIDSRGLPSDVKYIKCETCNNLVIVAAESADKLEGTALTEIALYDLTESLCDPASVNGKWMREIDLVERVGRLRLIKQDGEQDCTRECRTIALACNSIMEGYESELAEKLYLMKKKGVVDVTQLDAWFCEKRKGLTDACRVRAPMLPKDREHGPEFQKKDEKAAQMEAMMAQMKAANGGKDLGAQMFSKEQMANMPGMGGDDDDEDEDDTAGAKDDDGEETSNDDSSMNDPSLGETGGDSLEDVDGPADPAPNVAGSGAETVSDEL